MSTLRAFFESLKSAFCGICFGLEERSMQIHTAFAILVLLLAACLKLDTLSWFIILILIGLVWTAELFNTAIEELADLLVKENFVPGEATKKARDVSAGAVLILAIVAALIGTVIFGVRVFQIFGWSCPLW